MESHPLEGVYATRALFDAGDRPEETVSSAIPKAAMEAAVETADPLEEPDAQAAAKHAGLYGLSARLHLKLSVLEASAFTNELSHQPKKQYFK